MSRVYLQEIPNAPQSVGGGVMMRADVRVPSLGNVAGSLLQAKIPQGAFDGPAQGMAAVARGLAEAGKIPMKAYAAIEHWQQTEREVRDFKGLTEIELNYRNANASLDEQLRTQPESQWPAAMSAFAKSTRDYAAKQPLSDAARARADQYERSQLIGAQQRMVNRSRSDLIQGARDSAITLSQQLNDAGRYEDAVTLMTQARDSGLITVDEEERFHQQAIVRLNHRNMQQLIGSDPWMAQRVLEDDEKLSQRPDGREHMSYRALTEDDRANYLTSARQQIAERQRTATAGLDTAITSGQLRDPADLSARAAQAHLPKEEVASLQRSLRDIPVDTEPTRARYLANQSQLTTALETYDPQADTGDAGYNALRRSIRESLPLAERAAWFQRLDDRRQKGRGVMSILLGDAYRTIDRYEAAGMLGAANTAQSAAGAMMLKRQVAGLVERDSHATLPQITARVKTLLDTPDARQRGAGMFQQRLKGA